MSFEPGTVIAGKYRVERLLGEGGMGVVLAARHLGLDEMVALKLIKQERASGSDALARFQREARAAARIKSEHVARVLDVDRLPEGDPYIVMELIDGTDLHALVNRRRRLPPDEAASFIVQACEGLAEAHALGMVHRDLKLKNLFLTQRRDGRALIKVIDFGVVKFSPLADDDETHAIGSGSDIGRIKARDATLTSAAMLVGSVHYMAPEQIRASNVVDARADVWSLGVCLYVMLAGQLPFDGNTVAEVCAQIQGRPPIDVRQHAPHVSPELAAVVTRALEKNVHRRFGSVAELARALAPFHSDSAAQSRIETILESSIQARGGPAPVVGSNPATARFGEAHTQTADMTPQPLSPVLGRAESTIDAAAVGSLATQPAGVPTKRSSAFVGGIIAVLAAGITIAVWNPMGRAKPAPVASPAIEAPPSVVTTNVIPEPPPPPPATTVIVAPAPSALPAAKPVIAAPTPKKATKKHEPAAPAPAPKPAGQPQEKAEPKGAYDQF